MKSCEPGTLSPGLHGNLVWAWRRLFDGFRAACLEYQGLLVGFDPDFGHRFGLKGLGWFGLQDRMQQGFGVTFQLGVPDPAF